MKTYFDQVKEAAEAINQRVRDVPNIGIVLGSGFGDLDGRLSGGISIPYDQVPYWPPSGVVGHGGRLTVGSVKGRTVAALAGRSHAYEGHDPRTVTFAVRVLGLLGVRTLILTNAAGGINTPFEQGAWMVIDDHINLLGDNPLVGPNEDRFGPRFPDLSEVYSSRLRAIADQAGHSINLPLLHGVYAALLGPSYETPAEVRYLRAIGVDAVGMSTVPEAIVARHMGIEVLGLSCITNLAAGVLPRTLDHADVVETARRARGQFTALLKAILERL